MNITRHNYEEYFVLYMDNELDSEQRREVESFVGKNPDLKEELDLIQQFRMEPDTSVVFRDKEELMSGAINGTIAATSIELSNYEEWLVLYMDNELDAAQRKTIERFIDAHPRVKNEWHLLQRTRLQPETIVFADKSSLYRSAEKVRRIPTVWWRVAAVILLMMVAGTVAVIVLNNRRSSSMKDAEIVKTQDPVQQNTNTEMPVISPKEVITPAYEPLAKDNNQKKIDPAHRQTLNDVVSVKEKKDKVKNQSPIDDPGQVKKEEPVIVENNKSSNNLPQPENNRLPLKKTDPADAVANTKNEFQSPNALTNVRVTPTPTHSSDIVYAKNESGTDDSAPGGKKNNLRSMFRKVTRTLEKRTNIDATDGEDRLLVAGLAIKLK